MEKELMEAMVSSFTSEIMNQSRDILSGAATRIKQFINRGLKKYLEKQRDKYSYVKTLLKGNTPIYLYDIYYHLKIANSSQVIDTKNINNVFAKSKYITLIGDAGSGKSTLVKHLFLNSILEKAGIPILVELRYLNEYRNSFEDYINDKILENKLSENIDILQGLLKNGKFIFFLDGFDELNTDIKTEVIESLSSFINSYDNNRYIITTRPYSDIEHLPLFHNYHVQGLNKENGEIEGFIHKQLQNETELALKIVDSIKNNKSEFIDSFLKNPLLLTLYILTFQSDSSIPNRKYIFYRRVINALFSEHDSKSKLGYPREKISKLNQEQFEEILKAFCFVSYFDSKYSWDTDYISDRLRQIKHKLNNIQFDNNDFIKDLKLAIALWVDDNGSISFAHRSLQEYFAALAIKHLNPQQNQRIYTKIIDRFSSIRSSNEIENFLSLCEEMDTVNFKKYYLLPLLLECKTLIEPTDDFEIGRTFLIFFTKGLNFSCNTDQFHISPVDINENIVYKSIYIHLQFTQKLYTLLSDLCKTNKLACTKFQEKTISIPVKENNKNEFKFKHIPISAESFPEDLWKICGDEITELAKQFYSYLTTAINENTAYVKNSEDLDKDLVDLI
jgi:predicted NACHT family NTPase